MPSFKILLQKCSKPVVILLVLLALYTVIGFIALPKLLRSKLPELISQNLGVPASISTLELNPLSGQLKVTGFDLRDKHKQPLLTFAELFVDVDAFASLKSRSVVIDELHLHKPVVRITALKQGGFNVSSLFQPEKKPEKETSKALFPLQLNNLQLTDGEFHWRDETLSQPMTETFKAVHFSVKDFTTQANQKGQVTLTSQLAKGGKLNWKTELSVAPFENKGHISLEKLSLNRLWTLFLKDLVNFKIPQGDVNLGFDYQLSLPKDKLQLSVQKGLLTAQKLQFTAEDNDQPVLTIPEFAIKDVEFNLSEQRLKIAEIAAQSTDLKMALDSKGHLNYQSIFSSKSKPQTPTKPVKKESKPTASRPWIIAIGNTQLQKTHIEFKDPNAQAVGMAKIDDVDIKLHESLLNFGDQHVQITIKKGGIGGQDVAVLNIIEQQAIHPLSAKLGEFQFTLGEYKMDYHASKLLMTAKDGSFAGYDFSFDDAGSKKPLLSIPDLSVQGAQFDLAAQKVSVQKLRSEQGILNSWLDKQGKLNFQQLLKTKAEPSTSKQAPKTKTDSETPTWQFNLDELDIQNYQLNFTDNTQKEPVILQLTPFNVKIQQVSNKKGNKLPVTLQTKINKTGELDIKGFVSLEPFHSELQTSLKNLSIKNLEEYLNDYLKVDIIDGAIETRAKINLSQSPNSSDVNLNIQGSADIKKLVLRDQLLNKDLVNWQSFKFEAVDFDLAKSSLDIGNILIQKPYARITIKQDRSMNFDDIIIKRKPGPLLAKVEQDIKAVKPSYKIGNVTIAGGISDFSDFSLILPFVVELNNLNGSIKKISSEQKSLTDFNLAGKVFDLSPMDVKGNLNADLSYLDVGMHFKGMPLPFVSPYMVEFAGYKIEKGKMSVDLLYKIADRKLTAENNFMLEQLSLGEKIDNPKATSLPLKLAIALLKDSEGRIKINMPISGSLDDPNFSVMPLLWDAFTNMITRAVSSPFSALGSLISDSGDLSEISFVEGEKELTQKEIAKLDDIAKALQKKPELHIDIKGRAYEKPDWPAMQDDALLDQLKAMKADELRNRGKSEYSEYVELSDSEYKRLLADLFIQKFPRLAKRSFLGTPELINSKADFYQVAKNELSAIIPPNKLKLAELASGRARGIAQYLIQKGGIDEARIYLLDSDVQSQSPKPEVTCSLALTVQ